MGGDRFSSGDASARGDRSRGRRHRRRHRRPVGETHRSGYDAGKKIKGGKRHIVTDTGGLPVAVMVHEADIRDRAGAAGLLASTAISYPWPSHIFAEGGYGGGKLRGALDKTGERTIEIIERSDTAKGGSSRCPAAGWWSVPSPGRDAAAVRQRMSRQPSKAPLPGLPSPASAS